MAILRVVGWTARRTILLEVEQSISLHDMMILSFKCCQLHTKNSRGRAAYILQLDDECAEKAVSMGSAGRELAGWGLQVGGCRFFLEEDEFRISSQDMESMMMMARVGLVLTLDES